MKSIFNATETKRPICDFCLGDVNRNKQGAYEDMLCCKDCNAKAHPSCMNYSKALAVKALSYPWQCVECKTCIVCCSARNGANILFCDGCDKAFHMNCHRPKVVVKPEGKWICAVCEDEDLCASYSSSVNKSNGNYHENLSEVSSSVSFAAPNSNGYQPDICMSSVTNYSNEFVPNAVNWSSEQVANYFKDAGFSDQASVFLQEEIDGRSLLLLKRTDVISGLSLKLGPAVKIYEHIKKLQNASLFDNTDTNGWNLNDARA